MLFGRLVETGEVGNVASGYILGAVLMILAGLVEIPPGVAAERRSLEDVAEPLTVHEARTAAV